MLNWTLDGTLSKSDSLNLFTHLVRHPLGRYMSFEFFKVNWDFINERYAFIIVKNLFTSHFY